jgi:hypothetical protein
LASAALLLAGCSSQPTRLPSAAELEGLYGEGAELRLNGNVVDVRVDQDPSQIRRGGSLWARVGPYIFLFSPQTEELLQRFPDVAAVRVRTYVGGRLVAKARLEGTRNPAHLENLVRYGEDHTRFEYASRFTEK